MPLKYFKRAFKALKTRCSDRKGDVLIRIPRDSDSSFNPVTVLPKHETTISLIGIL